MMFTPPLILVVDDDPHALKSAERLLSSSGYRVLTASGGGEALNLVREGRPDLVLLDVVLPDIDGVEVCERIKADPQLEDVFVILYSGIKTHSEHQTRGLEGGADGYIVRPVPNKELLARVQAMLRLSEARTELRARKREQEAVAGFSRLVLEGAGIPTLLDRSVDLVAQTLNVSACEIFEALSDGRGFALRACSGWPPDSADRVRPADGADSFLKAAAAAHKAVLVEDWREETRFAVPKTVPESGVISSVGFPVRDSDAPCYVLIVHTTGRRPFTEHDFTFLESISNALSMSIQRNRTEDRHRVSKEHLQLIIDSAPTPISYIDSEQRYVFNNMAYQDWFGLAPSRIRGSHIRDIVGEEAYNVISPHIEAALSGEQVSFEREVSYKNAGLRYIQAIYTPHFDPSGHVKGFVVLVNDMTERKRAEHLFSQFAENVDSVIWMASIDGSETIYVNKAYETIWGRSRESIFQKPMSWLDAVYPEDREQIRQVYPRRISEEHHIMEYRIMRPDGTTCWIRDRCFPIRSEKGGILFLAGIAEDCTEEKRLKQEAEYRLQQIIQADKLASLGEVVAGVAHEINNPNSFITYNVPLLQQTWRLLQPILVDFGLSHPEWRRGDLSLDELCSDMEEIIEDIGTGSERINKVVKNLKDFARMDEVGQPRGVKINEVIEKTMVFTGFQLRKKAARIDLNLGEGLPEIEGHFSRLEQVVANLLINAAHAICDKERGRISVATRWVERLQSVLIEIEDNGAGMSREIMERVLDPFYTTRRASGGTGLGLSVSHGLVQEHNGRIGIISRPGAGSRFTVFLPVADSVKLDLHPTILCVDDDASHLTMLKVLFMRVKQYFKGVHDPESVLAFLEEHPEVDIVLSDLVMPNMNGWELLARVKERFPLLHFILYSGDTTALQSRPGHVPEPDYVLEKPFNISRLAGIIESLGRQKFSGGGGFLSSPAGRG